MTGVMHASFSVGLLAGILLASVVVFGSVYASAPTQPVLGSFNAVAGQAKTTTATSTSSSTTAAVPAAASINAQVSTTTSTNSSLGFGTNAASPPSGSALTFAASALPSPRLATLFGQPDQAPLLLLPVVAALLFGFVLYKTSARKE